MRSLKSDRTTVRRMPRRGSHDRETIHAILDEALICHVGFVAEGQPVVIPTIHTRIGQTLYFHGSTASRMLRMLKEGVPVCVNVTILDGLVLARSSFNHSMNYRSVVIFGTAREVADRDEKLRVLEALVEHVVAGRSREARRPNENELKATSVLALPITEASAKIRTGGPVDDEQDLAMDIWAGVLPLRLTPGDPQTDGAVKADVPAYLRQYRREQR